MGRGFWDEANQPQTVIETQNDSLLSEKKRGATPTLSNGKSHGTNLFLRLRSPVSAVIMVSVVLKSSGNLPTPSVLSGVRNM